MDSHLFCVINLNHRSTMHPIRGKKNTDSSTEEF
jgi:hypothetical protein